MSTVLRVGANLAFRYSTHILYVLWNGFIERDVLFIVTSAATRTAADDDTLQKHVRLMMSSVPPARPCLKPCCKGLLTRRRFFCAISSLNLKWYLVNIVLMAFMWFVTDRCFLPDVRCDALLHTCVQIMITSASVWLWRSWFIFCVFLSLPFRIQSSVHCDALSEYNF